MSDGAGDVLLDTFFLDFCGVEVLFQVERILGHNRVLVDDVVRQIAHGQRQRVALGGCGNDVEAILGVDQAQRENGEAGCDTEKAARGETANSVEGRIADFRTKIAARAEAEGKEYLSFYFVEAQSYEIVE